MQIRSKSSGMVLTAVLQPGLAKTFYGYPVLLANDDDQLMLVLDRSTANHLWEVMEASESELKQLIEAGYSLNVTAPVHAARAGEPRGLA